LKPTSKRSAAEAKLAMWPPSSACARLARTTMASAFQRMIEARRCSMVKSPGNGGCSCGQIVLQ
jgi:hypothetical protein